MTSGADQPIKIEVIVPPDQPGLLEGLDTWLRLGLISDAQVRQLSQTYLVSAVPQPTAVEASMPASVEVAAPQASPVAANAFTETDFVLESAQEQTPSTKTRPERPNFVARRLQSLMAEISVMWLLFLGVFMVVVSSGVLAASQWKNFPPAGQYGILFGYTLAFWAASVWTSRQANLRLTSRMLQITTLLIIPVNFWMIDGFQLWTNGLGWGVAAIAALGLTVINITLLQADRRLPGFQAGVFTNHRLVLFNSLGLSWLQWGWALPGVPLLATYIGTVGTALLLFYQQQNSRDSFVADQPLVDPVEPEPSSSPPVAQPSPREALSLGVIVIAFATLLLIVRAVFVAQIPVSQLGLALGSCGWLLCWLAQNRAARQSWTPAGVGLLLAGWAVSVGVTPPWQAIAVSGLGIWLLLERLRRLRQIQDLTALFLIGLQSLWLLWRVVPLELQQSLVTTSLQLAGDTARPWMLISVAAFPYIGLTLLAASRLRHWQQAALAQQAEVLALILGVILSLLSLTNPLLRSLNFLLSTVTLAVVVRRRTASELLIYLTHILGLLTIASWIDLALPTLDLPIWIGILIVGTVAEWAFTLSSRWPLWRQSAWHLGLALAGLSYILLWNGTSLAQLDPFSPEIHSYNWLGLVAPVALTGLAMQPRFPHKTLAHWLSLIGFLVVQPLTIATDWRLLSLGTATGCLLLNTRYLQQLFSAILTVGFSLGFSGALVWQIFADRLTNQVGLNLVALAVLVLWILRGQFLRRSTPLSRLYTTATDGWAIAIASCLLFILMVYDLYCFIAPATLQWEYGLVAVLTVAAIGYRHWQQPNNWSCYGLAWSTELLVASAIALQGNSWEALAIANLGLGLATQLAGDWWVRRTGQNYWSSWHVIPLLYAGLGLLLQHGEFDATTGLYTLSAALVGIGVGRRQGFKLLTYLSLAAVTIAAYELLVYQLLQAQGGQAGDGLVLLGALAAVLAVSYQLLSRWLLPFLRLSVDELHTIAHLHWIGSSGLLLLAPFASLSRTGGFLWVGVTIVLAIYALWQGRWRESWTYAGIFAGIAAIGYWLYLVIPEASFLLSWAAALACVLAYGMYTLPWQTWGWSVRPWRRSAALLPGLAVLVTSWGIDLSCLLIVAAFYAWFAKAASITRLSYVSILLADWAILRFLETQGVQEPLWYASAVGGSLLYVAQVDPYLRSQPEREKRHLLRTLATGLIGLTALYQSEIGAQGMESLLISVLTLGFGIALIVAGLSLQIRAFLYVGTALFIIKVLRQLWLFINDYSLLLWALGILLGLAFIWIAATFEARRSQVSTFVQYWVTELQAWQ